MAAPFALVGLGAGLLLTLAISRTRTLATAQQEARLQNEAHRAMERLAMEVAHHVLNANTAISSRARSCENTVRGASSEHLRVIPEESADIDAVVTSLRQSAQQHSIANDWNRRDQSGSSSAITRPSGSITRSALTSRAR